MLRLFYFSGTGTARHVAHWRAAVWREHGREATVVDPAKPEVPTAASPPTREPPRADS